MDKDIDGWNKLITDIHITIYSSGLVKEVVLDKILVKH
jgi:hypothetical protein